MGKKYKKDNKEGDRQKFSNLDELAEEDDEDYIARVPSENATGQDAAKAQDMVDQLCEKITRKVDSSEQSKAKKSIPWKIYISRAMTAWGDRLWSFGAGIFINLLAPENLRLVAIYGFATSVSVIFFGAVIGAWIDKTSRLTAAKTFLIIQNLVVAICCAILATFFWLDGLRTWPSALVTAVPIVVILLAVVADLASVGSRIAVEKDWIVVISGNDNDQLAKMNSVFRTIDLLCLLVAPSLAGIIFDFLGNNWAAVFIALWNILSVTLEYFLLISIYKEFLDLSHKKIFTNPATSQQKECSFASFPRHVWNSVVNSLKAWLSYMKHPARDAGLGLAFLYMTVLGFDNITYGYCLRQCVTESILGGLVAGSAIFGVSGSLSFPVLRRKIGLNKTGLIGMASLVATLSMCVISIWVDGSPFDVDYFKEKNSTVELVSEVVKKNETEPIDNTECYVSSYASVSLFLGGVIAARYGLWMADLSITQVLQERVEEEHRGILNGVQNGLNSAMNTIKFILVIVLPEAETFGWLIITSFVFICFGALSYSSYVCKNRESKKPKESLHGKVGVLEE